jgi:hypothetical protein
MDRETLTKLEFDKILAQLAALAYTPVPGSGFGN